MRYRSLIYDSARWQGFEFRPGDIVISTPPKCGTTWTQMLVALLIFGGPDFPAHLSLMSPWVDMCNRRLDDVRADLDAQAHRRFMKTHTPLDGLPIDDGVTYIVVGRDPRDVAVSFKHHFDNLDIEQFMRLRAEAVGLDDLAELPPRRQLPEDPRERFLQFIDDDTFATTPCLHGVLHHLDTAWDRRDVADVHLFHYADYAADLPAELLRLATALEVDLTPRRARELAPEAALDRMRDRAHEVAPSASMNTWKDVRAFFRSGGSGEWRSYVTDADLERYEARVAELTAPDRAAWAHEGRLGSGVDPAKV